MYTPIEAAKEIGIGVSTLRLWAKIFSDHLSPAANRATTEHGTPAQRRFTDDDLAVLGRVKELLSSGLRYEQVAAVLSGGATEPQDTPPSAILSNEPQPRESGLVAAYSALQQVLQDRDRLIAALETRNAELRSDHDRELAAKDAHIADLRAQLAQTPPPKKHWWQR